MSSPKARKMISGVECIFGMNCSLPEVQPWVQTIFELFGTKRVMFDSHRPICGLSSSFPTPYRAYEKMTDGLSLSEEDAVFRLNAADWFFWWITALEGFRTRRAALSPVPAAMTQGRRW